MTFDRDRERGESIVAAAWAHGVTPVPTSDDLADLRDEFFALSDLFDERDEQHERDLEADAIAIEDAARKEVALIRAGLLGTLRKGMPTRGPADYRVHREAKAGAAWAMRYLHVGGEPYPLHWFASEKATGTDDSGPLRLIFTGEVWGFAMKGQRGRPEGIALSDAIRDPAFAFAVAAHEVGHLAGGMDEPAARRFESTAYVEYLRRHPNTDVREFLEY